MKKNRGCQNINCKAHKKKMRFKAYMEKCPLCGEELVHVCKKCYKPLDDDSKELCPLCYSKAMQRKETGAKISKGVLGTVGTIAAIYLSANKDDVGEQVGGLIDRFKKE